MSTRRFVQLSHWGAYTAIVEDGRFVSAEPFARDPAPSRLLESMPAMVYSNTRILRPAVRRSWLKDRDRTRRGDDSFVEVEWDRALALVADELARVRSERGAQGIFGGSYGWSSAGRFHHARTQLRRFLYSGGGCTDQIGNYSWGAAQFLLPHVIGTHDPVSGRVTDWASVIGHTQRVIAFGGFALRNGQITSGGAGVHTLEQWLRAAQRRGIDFVIVSPDRHDVPPFLEAQWIPIRPNTDTALMLALAHVLVARDLHDRAFLARHCVGFEAFARYLLGTDDGIAKTPAWAAAICGIDASVIEALALGSAGRRTLLTLAWSLQRAHHGEQPYWMAIVLAAMMGQIGLPGGGFAFGHGSMNGVGNPRADLPFPDMPMGANPARRAVPVARFADMLLGPGEPYAFDGRRETYPDVGLVYWAGGNPFHHHQDLNRLQRAWARPETVIVHESWWTATARRADIVLPATTTLERDDIGGSSRDRYVFAMQRAIAPVGGSRNDQQILAEIADRLGCGAAYTEGRDEDGWLGYIWSRFSSACARVGFAVPDYAAFRSSGFLELPLPGRDFVLFESFRADPDANPLRTPSGKIEITSPTIASFSYADCPGHPKWLPPGEWLGDARRDRYPLHLVTVQPADRLHSQMDPGPVSQANKVHGRERLRLHPAEASKRNLSDGDIVRAYNDRGACLAGLKIDAAVMPGVAIIATGAWYDPDASGLDRQGNPNVLTMDIGTSQLTQGPSALSALIEVARWDGALPDSPSPPAPAGVVA
jgi:biotin/methionine sulfoxide reductase